MKSLLVAVTRSLVLTVLICLFAVAPVNSDGYDAFGDVKESKTVFDLHVNTPRSAWVYQDLIHQCTGTNGSGRYPANRSLLLSVSVRLSDLFQARRRLFIETK